jgi:hypothetical protein
MGMVTPETAKVEGVQKELGPAAPVKETTKQS